MTERNEVIGFLGGWYDKENRVLFVQVRTYIYFYLRRGQTAG